MFKKFCETYSNIQVFNVKVKNIDEVIDLIEGFDEKNGGKNWDDLANTNWKKDNVNNSIEVKDVKRINQISRGTPIQILPSLP